MGREWITTNCAKGAGRYFDQLRVGHVGEHAVVSDHREVRTSGNFLGMFVFLDLEGCDPNNVIVLQSQLDGLLQIHGARNR